MERQTRLIWWTLVVMAVVATLFYLVGKRSAIQEDENDLVQVLPSSDLAVGPPDVQGGNQYGRSSAPATAPAETAHAAVAKQDTTATAESLALAEAKARAAQTDSVRSSFVKELTGKLGAGSYNADQARIQAVKLRELADSVARQTGGKDVEIAARQKIAETYRKAADLLVNSRGANDKQRMAGQMLKNLQVSLDSLRR